MQVIEVKFFDKENKKNIKYRIHLSDGISTAISMVSDKVAKSMDSINKYSIIKAKGTFMVHELKEKKILVFKEAPEILYTGLTKVLGHPNEFEKNGTEDFESTETDLSIPVNDTIEFIKNKGQETEMVSTSSGSKMQVNNAEEKQNKIGSVVPEQPREV